MTEKLREAIKSFKQNGLTLIVCYHSIEEISTELIRLYPHHIFVKRTGDKHAFSQISKARKLGNYYGLMQAYYRPKFT
jgi:ABC-type multidrug transport system ATPase subunit